MKFFVNVFVNVGPLQMNPRGCLKQWDEKEWVIGSTSHVCVPQQGSEVTQLQGTCIPGMFRNILMTLNNGHVFISVQK
jgi:hypothetical protein